VANKAPLAADSATALSAVVSYLHFLASTIPVFRSLDTTKRSETRIYGTSGACVNDGSVVVVGGGGVVVIVEMELMMVKVEVMVVMQI
jgi:hypothetical protein